MNRMLTLALVCTLAGGLAQAQDTDATSWTVEEFLAAYPDLSEGVFEQLDLNSDGKIDPDEYLLAIDAGLIMPLEG